MNHGHTWEQHRLQKIHSFSFTYSWVHSRCNMNLMVVEQNSTMPQFWLLQHNHFQLTSMEPSFCWKDMVALFLRWVQSKLYISQEMNIFRSIEKISMLMVSVNLDGIERMTHQQVHGDFRSDHITDQQIGKRRYPTLMKRENRNSGAVWTQIVTRSDLQ